MIPPSLLKSIHHYSRYKITQPNVNMTLMESFKYTAHMGCIGLASWCGIYYVIDRCVL